MAPCCVPTGSPLPARTALTCGGAESTSTNGGNIQVLSDPEGWPLWTSLVRPGREHVSTCAKAAGGLLAMLEQAAAEQCVKAAHVLLRLEHGRHI